MGIQPGYAGLQHKKLRNIILIDLPKGIVYIDEETDAVSCLRHQVTSIENSGGQPGEGLYTQAFKGNYTS